MFYLRYPLDSLEEMIYESGIQGEVCDRNINFGAVCMVCMVGYNEVLNCVGQLILL